MEERGLSKDNRLVDILEDLKPLIEVISDWISRENSGFSKILRISNALYDEISNLKVPNEVNIRDILELLKDKRTLRGIYLFLLLMKRIGEEIDKEV
ncbi:MAG: hypothetical protein QXV69_09085 [Sulfolobaceae archaeon]